MKWLSLLGLDAWLARWRTALKEGAIAVEDRAELARLEWAQLKRHGLLLLLLSAALLVFAVVTLVALSAAVLLLFWDGPQRVLAAWIMVIVWLLVWVCTARWAWSTAQRCRHAFTLTRRELAQDWREFKEHL